MKIDTLIQKVYHHPTQTDFRGWINEHIQSDEYVPYWNDEHLRKAISICLSKNDYLTLLNTCYAILNHLPFDIESHILIAQASFKLNRKNLFHLHNYIASSLLDVVLHSGDGKSKEKAYIIHYPQDEIAVFTFFKRYPVSRMKLEENEKYYDVYEFNDKEKMFFDITIPFVRLWEEMNKNQTD